MPTLENQLKIAVGEISAHASKFGVALGKDCADAAVPTLNWIKWFRLCRPASHATELLDGASASVLEAVSYVSLGLGRAALAAIRTQIDLLLSFTYFREHPAEWRLVNWAGDGFKLRSDILKYHREMDGGRGGFADRLGMMDQVCKPTLEECYRTLSAHVHGQSSNTVPKTGQIKELVSSEKTLTEIVKIQHDAALALSGYLLTVHAREWNELPPEIVSWGRQLLKPDQVSLFFSTT